VSIRFKVILPYLLLTLIVAMTGAYVVTRLVANSLGERLSNQLLEAGRVVSGTMARQESRHLDSARIVAFTDGFADALRDGNLELLSMLAKPVTGGLSLDSLIIFDARGNETLHFIKQSDGSLLDVSGKGNALALSIVDDILTENNPNSLPKRQIAFDPVDNRYYYFTSIPVASEGQVVGAAVVGTALNTLVPLLESTAAADVIIYDSNGYAIASTLGSQGMTGEFLETLVIPKTLYDDVIARDDSVSGKTFEVDGRRYSLVRGPLKVAGDRLAVFAVVLPEDFIVQANLNSRNFYALLYGGAMIAVVLLGYLITRLIINPLYQLVRTSRAIAGGDLNQRTRIKSRDEIGVLANTFDEMTENLQQRTLELERTNKLLEQMDNTKMRFIQVAAHELRTPLTLVQGYAQMAEIKSAGNAELEKYSRGIQEGTTRMVEIIDGMLDISRIDNDLLEPMYTDVRLDAVAEKVRKVFQESLEERSLSLHIDGLSGIPAIRADKDLLYKVLYQVIGNAVKYTPDGGKIIVGARILQLDRGNSEVEVTVKDTGIGIDPQFHELVFEKFYQTGEVLLHSSGKTKFKGGGPGLGLAIARGIVNAHRGRIWLESPGHDEIKNPGTTVFIRLPMNGSNDAGA